MTNCCPKCHSERVEITDSECICFACGLTQERYDYPMSAAYAGYAKPQWAQSSTVPEVQVIERVESADLRPIKAELNYLHTKIMQMQTRKKKGGSYQYE